MSIVFRFRAEDLLQCRFPAPSGPFTEIDAELERVRATVPDRVAAELAQCLDRRPAGQPALRDHPGLSGDPAQARDLLAGMLHRAWSALVEPWWPRLRDVLDADITFRARQLANAGVAAALGGLDRRISWRDGVLRFASTAHHDLDLTGTDLPHAAASR
jgi:hypothetical protein